MSTARFINDGAARTSATVTILETGEDWVVEYTRSFPGSMSVQNGIRNRPLSQHAIHDINQISATFTPTLGNALPIEQESSCVIGGKGYIIPGTAEEGEPDQVKKFTATCNQVINGLIVTPARPANITLIKDVAMTPVALTVSADTATGGVWSVSGIAGVTVTGTNITGTPTANAGDYPFVIRYTLPNGMVIERGFLETVAAA